MKVREGRRRRERGKGREGRGHCCLTTVHFPGNFM